MRYMTAAVAGFLVVLVLCSNGTVRAESRFLAFPFVERDAVMSEAPQYSDDGTQHLGAGFAFDYIAGNLSDSSTWRSFPVLAAASGRAIRSCEGATESTKPPYTSPDCDLGYGHFILIRHDATTEDGRHYFTLYAHLDPDTIDKEIPYRPRRDTDFDNWKAVKQGDELGKASQSGKRICVAASCIHLHFEVFRGGYMLDPVDPYDISRNGALKPRTQYPELSSRAQCGPDSLWLTCPTPPSRPATISLGRDLVVAGTGINVREEPTTTATSITKLTTCDGAVVVGEPVYTYPRWWWNVDIGQERKGWMAEEYLRIDTPIRDARVYSNWRYTEEHEYGISVDLWRCEGSYAGMLYYSPGMLVGNTPRGVLEQVYLDPASGRLSFNARLSVGEHVCAVHKAQPGRDLIRFDGVIDAGSLSGRLTRSDALHPERPARTDSVVLERQQIEDWRPRYKTWAEWRTAMKPDLEFAGPRW